MIVHLDALSYSGMGIGGGHYYGKLYGRVNGKKNKIDLEYELTKVDAARLNRGDKYQTYEEGHTSRRFRSKTSIVSAALIAYKRDFPGATVLLWGSVSTLSPQEVLDAPEPLRSELSDIYENWDSTEYPEADEFDDEWEMVLKREGLWGWWRDE